MTFPWNSKNQPKAPEIKKAHVNSQGQTIVSANDLLQSDEVKQFMREFSPKVDGWIKQARTTQEKKSA